MEIRGLRLVDRALSLSLSLSLSPSFDDFVYPERRGGTKSESRDDSSAFTAKRMNSPGWHLLKIMFSLRRNGDDFVCHGV